MDGKTVRKARNQYAKENGLNNINEDEPIDENDPIEKLIVKSVRLGEEAARRRRMGIGPLYEIEALEAESEKIWAEAKRLGKKNVTETNYENLANAFLKACIEDYEELISGAAESPKKNFELIADVLENQMFVKVDLIEQCKRIKRVYETQFVPFVGKYRQEIFNEWKMLGDKGISEFDRGIYMTRRCPLCGGALHPKHFRRDKTVKAEDPKLIVCTGCKLYY